MPIDFKFSWILRKTERSRDNLSWIAFITEKWLSTQNLKQWIVIFKCFMQDSTMVSLLSLYISKACWKWLVILSPTRFSIVFAGDALIFFTHGRNSVSLPWLLTFRKPSILSKSSWSTTWFTSQSSSTSWNRPNNGKPHWNGDGINLQTNTLMTFINRGLISYKLNKHNHYELIYVYLNRSILKLRISFNHLDK